MSITTFAGPDVDIFNFREADVNIHTIAHGLATQTRWAGQAKYPFWIAQHSFLLSMYAPHFMHRAGKISSHEEYETVAAVALMHDAAEAYIHDITRPLKAKLPVYAALEEQILRTIFLRYGLPFEELERIKVYDLALGCTEQQALFANPGRSQYQPLEIPIEEWTWQQAEGNFLLAFQQLVEGVYDEKQLS